MPIDWSKYQPGMTRLPSSMLFGAATSAHQVEGNMPENNWTRFEASVDAQGKPRIKNGERSGRACEHYERFRSDLALAKQLGLNAYRFSIEWARVEPRPGSFDAAAIRHYHEVLDTCLELGLEPMVTLHHFTHPTWFEDAGGFENLQNIDHFVRFAERMFDEYQSKVRLWATLNEPNVFVVQGYFFGIFPPGVQDVPRAARTYLGVTIAHSRVYRALKSRPGGDRASIGLVLTIFQVEPWSSISPFDRLVASVSNQFFNETLLRALETGEFHVGVRGFRSLTRSLPEAKGAGDFLGLNYYSRIHLTLGLKPPFLTPRYLPHETMTDMPYAMYPDGFYHALLRASRVGMPLYVTENGIADARDDRREDFIERYLFALEQAVREGVDVRGYFYWSLLDNFEWSEGYGMRFGLFEVDYSTQERRLRTGSLALQRAIRRSRGE